MKPSNLIPCSVCGQAISETAQICPGCGHPNKKKASSCLRKMFYIFFGFIALSAIIQSFHSPTERPSKRLSTSTKSDPPNTITEAPTPKPGDQWSYINEKDEMSNGYNHYAYVYSENDVFFDFPYQGPQKGKLTIRTHARHGKDVIFSIEKGQLLCSSYEGCEVIVRFDERDPKNFTAGSSADHNTEVLFIQDYTTFVGEMMKSKRVRISPRVYQEGSPVFDFDVIGFDVKKYKEKPRP